MKKILFISCGTALLFLVATVFAADKKAAAPAYDAQAKVAELAKQVDDLQAKIKKLEQRLANLEKAKSIATAAPITGGSVITVPEVVPNFTRLPGIFAYPLQGSFADPAHPPKIWGEGEFNGWKYYMIPLSASGKESPNPIPLAGEPLGDH